MPPSAPGLVPRFSLLRCFLSGSFEKVPRASDALNVRRTFWAAGTSGVCVRSRTHDVSQTQVILSRRAEMLGGPVGRLVLMRSRQPLQDEKESMKRSQGITNLVL